MNDIGSHPSVLATARWLSTRRFWGSLMLVAAFIELNPAFYDLIPDAAGKVLWWVNRFVIFVGLAGLSYGSNTPPAERKALKAITEDRHRADDWDALNIDPPRE